MGGWVDGWMDGWVGGWMDGWMQAWYFKYKALSLHKPATYRLFICQPGSKPPSLQAGPVLVLRMC